MSVEARERRPGMRRILTAGLLFGVFALSGVAQAQNAAEEHRAAGMAAYWKLHFQEAQGHFQAAVDADPNSAAALYYLGYTVYKIAEPKRPNDPGKRRAAELFARVYQIDPGFTPDWAVRGRP
jgi:tetratricopeptide (TPR) repeat protein